jgi:hypothetical protein
MPFQGEAGWANCLLLIAETNSTSLSQRGVERCKVNTHCVGAEVCLLDMHKEQAAVDMLLEKLMAFNDFG